MRYSLASRVVSRRRFKQRAFRSALTRTVPEKPSLRKEQRGDDGMAPVDVKRCAESQDAEAWFVDMATRNAHLFRR